LAFHKDQKYARCPGSRGRTSWRAGTPNPRAPTLAAAQPRKPPPPELLAKKAFFPLFSAELTFPNHLDEKRDHFFLKKT